jgi:hypothetical protein
VRDYYAPITIIKSSRRTPQRHRSKDLNFKVVGLIFEDAGITINMFVALTSRGRSDLIDLLDSIDVADVLEGCIFECDLVPLNMFTEMAGHAFRCDLNLRGDFDD